MKVILFLIGVLLIVAAVLGGLYVTFGYCLYGGIISIIHGCTANPVIAADIAFGIIRILFASLAGWVTFLITAFLAACFFGAASAVRSKRW